jgi:hypothetical protein
MRSIFLQYSTNQPQNIATQIEHLNNLVLDYAVFHVYSEAQSYIKYLYDVSSLAVPIAMPISVSQKDKNTHLMPKWF